MENNLLGNFKTRVRSKTINGSEYQITVLNLWEGTSLLKVLLKVCLPVLGKGVDTMGGELNLNAVAEDAGGFNGLAELVCSQLDQLDTKSVVEKLLNSLVVNRKEVDINEYFAANFGEFATVLEFALKENYSSFLEDGSLLTRLFSKLKR